MAIATLHITSELADGSYMHPTLPMSYLGEVIALNGENYSANYTINFNTRNWYTDPFFIMTVGFARYFYYQIEGSGNSFSISFERGYTLMEGKYKYYAGEGTNGITKPMFTDGRLYIGGSRG